MPLPYWEHFEHEADIGVRGIGNSLEEAYEQAAYAMMAVITDPATIEALDMIEIECQETDRELLLVDWLNALIYEIATRHMLFSRFQVTVNPSGIKASAWGEAIDVAKHQPAVELKGATFTELSVNQSDDHWIAQCVVDV